MTFEKVSKLAEEFYKEVFDKTWANAVASAGDDPGEMTDAFYAGPPSASGDAFTVAEKWLEEKHPEVGEAMAQELLLAVSVLVAGKIMAGIDDGLEVVTNVFPEEGVEVLAEAFGCKKVRLSEGKVGFRFDSVKKASFCESCLRSLGKEVSVSSRLNHSLSRRRANFLSRF